MKRFALLLAVVVCTACTSRYQLRGTEDAYDVIKAAPAVPPQPDTYVPKRVFKLDEFVGTDPVRKEQQITMEHRSVETFQNFTVGVIEVSDEGAVNPAQKQQVVDMVKRETAEGGVLIVFIHGWHHGPRTCDRDLCCFRRVLDELQKRRAAARGPDGEALFNPKEKIVGVFIGWRGESLVLPGLNSLTLFGRKAVAQRIGRTVGKEILVEFDQLWRDNDNLVMVSVGHSLGGAFLYEAMKGKLTGNIFDIEEKGMLRDYRSVRAREDREAAAKQNRKARRADIGDLVVLVNPAIEAIEWQPFDNDLPDDDYSNSTREQLVAARMPYDKNEKYTSGKDPQMPVLMTVASKADSAVGKLFPFFRWVQFLFSGRWDMFFKPQEWRGMGHYNPQTTHALNHPEVPLPPGYDPGEPTSPDCDCPFKNTYGAMMSAGFRLDKLDQQQTFGGYTMDLTPARRRRGPWDIHAPYFVVSTNKGVISAHSDIFNSVFVGFLVSFINAYDLEETSAEAAAKR
jgi:hypothetical protein